MRVGEGCRLRRVGAPGDRVTGGRRPPPPRGTPTPGSASRSSGAPAGGLVAPPVRDLVTSHRPFPTLFPRRVQGSSQTPARPDGRDSRPVSGPPVPDPDRWSRAL